MVKLVLVLIYPLLILARLANGVLGRDPLRLREPKAGSFWLPRDEETGYTSYFSESSRQIDRHSCGLAGVAKRVLQWTAGCFAPSRSLPDEKYAAAADREKGIPDEIYTLW